MSDQDNKAPTPPETALKDTSSKPDPIVFLEEDEDLDELPEAEDTGAIENYWYFL